jgi:hypothetical protein
MMAIRRIGVRRFRDLIALHPDSGEEFYIDPIIAIELAHELIDFAIDVHRRQPSEPTEIKSP